MIRRHPSRRLVPAAPALLCAALAAALLAPGRAGAQTEPFGCPRYVDVAPIADVNAPAGWSAASRPTRRWLRGAEMFEGDPAANQRIQGRLVDQSRGTTEWTIPPGSQAPTLVCLYQGTDVTLARVVPYGMRRCATSFARPDPFRRRTEEDNPNGRTLLVLCY
ncbi:STY0301 family protein [Caldovatus aquaticus]|uniref:Secreted protein n=1 Tax=Caldovatus aquaticus TaxID=2865671 RepID=A0ABS7F254_9PROT|nr:STY0301 family protein [Caldovatus aquaticus]MBW8269062.1 hypothetical protein [Caldovatus aquaticus]